MKLLDFGSLNIDHVYQLDHLVREGETLASSRYNKNEGGKGLNQAVALAKAGQAVELAGAIGRDGEFLLNFLQNFGVSTAYVRILEEATGHAMIQVDKQGRNSIILYGGANQKIDPPLIEEILGHFSAGDAVLLQNEISQVPKIIEAAAARGMQVILNPSPVSAEMRHWPLNKVNWFILNEIEGADLTGETGPEAILDELLRRYPACHIVLTLGEQGSIYADRERRVRQAAVTVSAVDTTAAGDTFTGYFLHALLNHQTVEQGLEEAAWASAITVSRPGAGKSIPLLAEVRQAMARGRIDGAWAGQEKK